MRKEAAMQFIDYGPDLERRFRHAMEALKLNNSQRALLNKIATVLGRPFTSAGWHGHPPIGLRMGTYVTITSGPAAKHFPLVTQVCAKVGLQTKAQDNGGLIIHG